MRHTFKVQGSKFNVRSAFIVRNLGFPNAELGTNPER